MRVWLLLSVALTMLGACRSSYLVSERPLAKVVAESEASGPLGLTARGVELAVEHQFFLMLPFPGAAEVSLEIVSDSVFTVSYLSEDGHAGPPARYQRTGPGRAVLRGRLLETEGWSRTSRPVLRFDGTGHITIERVATAEVPSDPEAALDRAVLGMPESVGHTTINLLTPPLVGVHPVRYLTDAAMAVAIAVLFVAGVALRRRARRGALALACAGLSAIALFDAHFLFVRYLPMLRPPRLDPEERIAKNYYFAAEAGELAALARKVLPPTTRVAVVGRADDWFGRQMLCFNLLPRPCVFLGSTTHEHVGIGGWPQLRDDELDAIVAYGSQSPLPAGWRRVSQISDNAYIARRP